MITEQERENFNIDLREINNELKTRPNIMASEYQELSEKKKEIIKRLFNKA